MYPYALRGVILEIVLERDGEARLQFLHPSRPRARRSPTQPLLACGHACSITCVASADRVAFVIAGSSRAVDFGQRKSRRLS